MYSSVLSALYLCTSAVWCGGRLVLVLVLVPVLVLVHQCGGVVLVQCGVVAAWAFQVFSLIVFPPRGERGEVEGKTSQVFLIL